MHWHIEPLSFHLNQRHYQSVIDTQDIVQALMLLYTVPVDSRRNTL